LNTPVVRIDLVTTGHGRPGYRVVARNPGGDGTVFEADALVIATPADTAADLSQHIVPQGVTPLQKIGYTPVTMVHVGMTEDSLPFRPEGFGFLTVKGSDARVLGVLWSSAMFDNRAPRGQVLLTLFYGGATDPEVIQESDDSVRRIVEEDLKRAMGWDGRCTLFRLKRHPRALPAYHLGHLARVKAIENAARSAPAPLRFVGNYLRGISVADCIRRAGETASELAGVLPT
jgi:oxygen-dependent protoporphyrinogen oxidase